MKKRIVSLLLVCAVLLALSLSAGAVDVEKEGFTDITVAGTFANTISVTPLKADGSEAEAVGGMYVDAVKLRVSYSAAVPSGYYLILGLQTDNGIPTENNILYLDQVTAGEDASFIVYPKEMGSGETCYLFLSSNADTGIGALTQVAAFTYTYISYKLGDVDGNGTVSSNDAVWVMNAIVGNIELDTMQAAAADVDQDGDVDVTDALFILQAVVHLRTLG